MSMDFRQLGKALNGTPTPATFPDVGETESELVVDHMTIADGSFPVVRDPQGNVAGPIREGVYDLKMGQLRLAKQGVARSHYNPKNDKKFPALLRNVEAGGLTDPLQVVPTSEQKTLPDGEVVWIYEVVLGVRGWWALKELQRPLAPCRIKKPDQVGQMIMDAIAKDNNHLKYSLFEHCEAARYLVDVLGYNQTLVAKRFSCSQPRISALLKAIRKQDERILQMMADDSLNLEQVCILVDAFPTDLETRVLCARYAIQHDLSNPQMQDVIKEITPDSELGGARAALVLANADDPEGAVERHVLSTVVPSTGRDPAVKQPLKFVLHRRSPMGTTAANVFRMARQAEFHISVNQDGPVTIADPEHTHVFDLIARWQSQAIPYITFQMFEEAYLADYQHAVQLVEEAGITTLPQDPEVRRIPIVESDLDDQDRVG